jgi:uncharacterized membrane protein YgdD (TMEM256/DUF423 family)
MSTLAGRLIALVAGLLGASGVGLAAVASHAMPDPALATAAQMLVLHAVAALAIAALGNHATSPRLWIVAASLLLLGATLFAGDIALRAFTGDSLFAMAAPIGGSTMILGWLAVAVAAAATPRADS